MLDKIQEALVKNYGLAGILCALLVIATPFVWKALDTYVWIPARSRETKADSRIDEQNENLLSLTREVASVAESTREVVRQNSQKWDSFAGTIEGFEKVFSRFIESDEIRKEYIEKRFNAFESELRQIVQASESTERVISRHLKKARG